MNPDSLCSEDALDPPAPLLKCCITGLCHHIRFPTLTSIRRSAQEWGCWSGLILRLILWGTPYCFHTAAHWRPCQQYTGVSLSSSFPGLFSVLWLQPCLFVETVSSCVDQAGLEVTQDLFLPSARIKVCTTESRSYSHLSNSVGTSHWICIF